MREAFHLKELNIVGDLIPKADKANAADLAAAIIEAQEGQEMEDLILDLEERYCSESCEELPVEVTRLFNALVNSSINRLGWFYLDLLPGWFAHFEA